MTAWAIEALIASALLMVLVLALRVPVRRAFGPQAAYALWLLPVARLLLPPLPDLGWQDTAAAAPIASVSERVSVLLVPVVEAAPDSASLLGPLVAALWLVGAAGFIGWHVLSYRRFRRRVLAGAQQVAEIDGVAVVESDGAPGPLAFGIARRFVAFPRDFAGRYDANERDLALAHELGHHQRGDLVANWVALAVLGLHWFSPVAWLAFIKFRADQEMANDARVLAGRSAAERHAYACAIVKAAHGGTVAAACHLHTVQDLKGRLRMLSKTIGRGRALSGGAGVAMLTALGLAATASGTQAAEQVRSKVEQATGVDFAAMSPTEALAPVAALVPTRALQGEAATPTTPATPVAPPASGTSTAVPERTTPRRATKRVVIEKDGERRVYEGAEAEAYIAANPLPVPPQPPVPPEVVSVMAAMPSTGLFRGRPMRVIVPRLPATGYFQGPMRITVPRVTSRRCGGEGQSSYTLRGKDGKGQMTVICTDRIEATTARAAEIQAQSATIERNALASALSGLRSARASVSATVPAEERAHALAAIDQSIAELEADIARAR